MDILVRHLQGCVLALLLLASAATAQTTGSLAGRIYDANNVPIRGAAVRLVGTNRGALTKTDGSFLIAGIRAGDYQVQVTAYGYSAMTFQARINIDQTTQLNGRFSPNSGSGLYSGQTVFFNPALQVAYLPFWTTLGNGTVSLKAYRLKAPLETLLSGYPGFVPGPQSAPVARMIDPPDHRLAATWEYTIPPGSSGTIDIPAPMREPGIYGVEAKDASGMLRGTYTVVVSEIGMVIKQSEDSTVAYLANAITGEREAGFPVTVTVNGSPAGTFTSREDGTIAIPLRSRQPGSSLLFYGERDGEILIATSSYNPQALPDRSRIFLHTDKPIYRPMQQVHFRGVARTANGSGGYDNVRGGIANVEIRDSKGSTVARDTIRISDLGTFAGAFQLGTLPPLGTYTIDVTAAGMKRSFSFAVEEYKKPEFAVDVAPSRPAFKAGETVEATVRARYFFGSPVAQGEVNYYIYRTPMHGSQAPGSEDATEQTTTMIHSGTGRLREDGTYMLRYPTSKDDQRNYTYSIRADVADNSRRTITGNASTNVTHGEFAVTVTTAKNLYIKPDILEATVRIRRFDGGRGEKIPFTFSARRVWWEQLPDGTSRQQSTTIQSVTELTDEEGNGSVAFNNLEGGYLELRAEAVTATDTSVGSRYVHSYDGIAQNWPTTAGEIRIIPEKDSYRPGELLRALVIPPAAGIDMLIATEGSRLHSYRVESAAPATIVQMPVSEAHTPNFFLSINAFHKGVQLGVTREIAVVPEHRRIDLRLMTDKDSYKPAEKGRIMVSARDHRGRPMRGVDVALAAVDASIYAIAPDRTPQMLAAFYPPLANTVATQQQIGADQTFITTRLNHYRQQPTLIGRINSVRDVEGAVWSIRGARAVESAIAVDSMELNEEMLADFATTTSLSIATEEVPVVTSGTGTEYDDSGSGAIRANHAPPPPAIRSDFRDVMLWTPSVRTDANGMASVEVAFPDNLTTWRFAARGIDRNTAVGEAGEDVVVRKDLLVRMETPRFMTQGDELVIATTVHNYLPTVQQVRIQFAVRNLTAPLQSRTVTIPPHGESRVDWPVTASTLDTARLAVRALGTSELDAMEVAVPVLPRGLQRRSNATVRLGRDETSGTMRFEIPPGSTPAARTLAISLSPSVSSSMMGALDDLIGYPYGCAEQTMTRFLPTIVVADAVRQLSIPFDKAKLEEMPKMVRAGLDRLYGFQHADGGWGWWEHDETHPFMTAYIMYGLSVARAAGYELEHDRFERGLASLRQQIETRAPAGNYGEQRSTLDAPSEAYMLYVASFIGRDRPDRLYHERTAALAATPGINTYAVALLALAATHQGDLKLASTLAKRLASSATETDSTVHWSGQTWDHSWQNDKVETSAYALKALLGSGMQDNLVARSVEWLMLQRQGNSWGNTRQTAMVLYTLTDYIRQMSLAGAEYRLAVKINGREVFNRKLTRGELLGPDLRIVLAGNDLRDGTNEVVIEKHGDGGLLASASLVYYTDVSAIRAADEGFAVEREYYTLRKEMNGDEQIYRKHPFNGSIASGEELLVKVRVKSDRTREYFMLEDPLPAGCEVVNDVNGFIIEGESEYSGAPAGEERGWRWWYASRELRDEKIAFFATQLEPGEYEFSYILRAQIPGDYNVMPSLGMLTYYPEVYGNSNAMRMTITDRGSAPRSEDSPSLR